MGRPVSVPARGGKTFVDPHSVHLVNHLCADLHEHEFGRPEHLLFYCPSLSLWSERSGCFTYLVTT